MNIRFLVSIALSLMLSATSQLRAATFVVNNLGDSGAGTLRQAILDANATAGDDAITFSVTGTITLTTNLPAITDNTAITGPGTNNLTINGAGRYSAFWLKGANSNSLSDLTISSTRTLSDWHAGGGIYTNASGIHSEGTLVLRRCLLTNCMSINSHGGAVYSGGDLDAEACIFTSSKPPAMSVDQSPGGAIYNLGQSRLKDCQITNCSTADLQGGGIHNRAPGSMFLTNIRIERCSGEDGGGIYNSGTMVITDSVIDRCTAGYWGGGIWGSGPLSMTNTSVINCSAWQYAGGLQAGFDTVLSGCTISSNKAAYSGAAILVTGNLNAYNCTVSQNRGEMSNIPPMGDAIGDKYYDIVGTVILNHCTVISNYAPVDVSMKASFAMANSILGVCNGVVDSEGPNLIVNTNGSTIINNVSGNIYNVNPRLGPLQNNGGPTWTHALLPGSTAIDNGNLGGLNTDQRGALRPFAADIGAYEVVSVTPPTLQIAPVDPTHVALTWPSAPGPVVLQQNAGLGSSDWSDVSTPSTDNGITMSVVLPTSGNGKFYRLRSP